MRITWVTRSFLDYRIPIYKEIDQLCGHQFSLVYNGEVVPEHCQQQMQEALGERHLPMSGERRLIGKKSNPVTTSQGGGSRIPWQPGILRLIKKTKPEVLVTDGFFQWTFPCILYKIFHPSVKHVMCYEGWRHTERNVVRLNTLYRKFASHFIDEICCNGSLSKEYVKSLGFPEERIHIGNMAADNSFFTQASNSLTENEKKAFKKRMKLNALTFIFSGRLVQVKGVAELLEAWKCFSQGREQEVSLLIVGDGPERPSLERYCHENQLNNVVFVGRVDYANLPIYYAASSVFILPTLQDNWSLVVPEAMACGLPIATSIYNGCYPELVQPCNGWVFDPKDHNSIVSTLEEIMKHKDELKQMGEASLEIVSHHTAEDAAKGIFKAIETSKGNT